MTKLFLILVILALVAAYLWVMYEVRNANHEDDYGEIDE